MPIYEYECADCGHRAEVLAGRGDPTPTCDQCGGGEMHRRFSSFSARSRSCSGGGACERWADGDRPSSCPPGRCCGIGD